MSKVEQIADAFTSLVTGQEAEDAKLECVFIAASSVENKIAYNANLDAPNLAMLMYHVCRQSEDFKAALQAVAAQLQEDTDRQYQNLIKFPVVKNKIVS